MPQPYPEPHQNLRLSNQTRFSTGRRRIALYGHQRFTSRASSSGKVSARRRRRSPRGDQRRPDDRELAPGEATAAF